MRKFSAWLLAVFVSGAFAVARAQAVQGFDTMKSQEELTRAVTELDRQLFDSYNKCDLVKFDSFFVDDVEFYHDKGGLMVGRKALTQSVKDNICGKVTRELVAGSLEVYPIHGYGAVEIGTHRFLHPAGSPDAGVVGEAKFIHLWQYKDGAWKITRVISYDHGLAK